MSDTDTEVMKRYESIEADSRAGAPAGVDRAEFKRSIEIRREAAIRDWRDILRRRSCAELTDTTKINAIANEIKDLARLHQMKVLLRWYEVGRGDWPFAWTWAMRCSYAGPRQDFDQSRWESFIRVLTKELGDLVETFEGRKYFQGRDVFVDELPLDYDQRDYSRPGAPAWADDDDAEEEEEGDDEFADDDDDEDDEEEEVDDGTLTTNEFVNPYLREHAEWIVDTRVWQSPPVDRENMYQGRIKKPAGI